MGAGGTLGSQETSDLVTDKFLFQLSQQHSHASIITYNSAILSSWKRMKGSKQSHGRNLKIHTCTSQDSHHQLSHTVFRLISPQIPHGAKYTSITARPGIPPSQHGQIYHRHSTARYTTITPWPGRLLTLLKR